MKELKIEVGKRYVRRDGKVTGKIQKVPSKLGFIDPVHEVSYYYDGSFLVSSKNQRDLIKEYKEETVEISKQFVKEAHSAACKQWKKRIEKEVPELFESDFKDGDWIQSKSNLSGVFLCIYDEGRLFSRGLHGFNAMGKWSDEINKGISIAGIKKTYRKATEEEVEEALIKEAKRRGYKNGNYESLVAWTTKNVEDSFFAESGYLWMGTGSGVNCVFKNGVWAEIIEEPKTKVDSSVVDKFREAVCEAVYKAGEEEGKRLVYAEKIEELSKQIEELKKQVRG